MLEYTSTKTGRLNKDFGINLSSWNKYVQMKWSVYEIKLD